MKRLLVESDVLVKEIAAEAGFNSVFYMNRTFKKCTGMRPGQYRRKHSQL